MYGNGRQKGTIRFALKPAQGIDKVTVADDFNGWKVLAMKKVENGTFVRHVPINRETSEYKFIVDGNGSWSQITARGFRIVMAHSIQSDSVVNHKRLFVRDTLAIPLAVRKGSG